MQGAVLVVGEAGVSAVISVVSTGVSGLFSLVASGVVSVVVSGVVCVAVSVAVKEVQGKCRRLREAGQFRG